MNYHEETVALRWRLMLKRDTAVDISLSPSHALPYQPWSFSDYHAIPSHYTLLRMARRRSLLC